MAPLALAANLATRWHHLHKFKIWPPDGTTCISSKFGHQMVPLVLVANLAIRWHHLHSYRWHNLHSYRFSYQVESLALPHCPGLSYWHYQLVLSWYLHQPESHQLSLQKVLDLVLDNRTHRSDPRDTWVR